MQSLNIIECAIYFLMIVNFSQNSEIVAVIAALTSVELLRVLLFYLGFVDVQNVKDYVLLLSHCNVSRVSEYEETSTLVVLRIMKLTIDCC